MSKRFYTRIVGSITASLLVLMVAVVSFLPACAPATVTPTAPQQVPTTPVADRFIKIGALMDMTGPLSPNHTLAMAGMNAFIMDFNDKGGFGNGIKAELVVYDTKYKVENMKSHYEKCVADPNIVAVFCSDGPGGEAIRPFTDRDRLPCVTGYTSPLNVFPPGYQFSAVVLSNENRLGSAEWLNKNAATYGKKSPIKIAFVGAELGFVRSHSVTLRKYASQLGYQIVLDEKVPYAPADCTAALLRVKDSGADVMMVDVSPGACARIIKDAVRLGVCPATIPFICSNYAGRDTAELLGDVGVQNLVLGSAAANGGAYFEDRETKAPVMVSVGKAMKKYQGKPEYVAYDFMIGVGVSIIEVALEGIKNGLAEVGYDKMNGETGRQAVYEGLVSIENFDTGGAGGIIKYGPDNRIGARSSMIVKLVAADAKVPEVHWSAITDWYPLPVKLTAADIPPND